MSLRVEESGEGEREDGCNRNGPDGAFGGSVRLAGAMVVTGGHPVVTTQVVENEMLIALAGLTTDHRPPSHLLRRVSPGVPGIRHQPFNGPDLNPPRQGGRDGGHLVVAGGHCAMSLKMKSESPWLA